MKLTQIVIEARTPALNPFEELPRAKSEKKYNEELRVATAEAQAAYDHYEAKANAIVQQLVPPAGTILSSWSVPSEKENQYDQFGNYAVRKDADPRIRNAYRALSNVKVHRDQLRTTYQNHTQEINQRKSEASMAQRQTKASARQEAFDLGNTIDEADVPEEIDVYHRRLKNAYFESNIERYAGDANTYPYSTLAGALFDELNAALKRNSIPELHTTYASATTYFSQNYGRTSNTSFTIIGGGCGNSGGRNSIVWEKIASGTLYRHNVYVSGQRVDARQFFGAGTAAQDQALKAYVP
jgi:hypothetical protein